LSFHNHILTHQNKVINKTWAHKRYIHSMSKLFKTIIMAFKVINDFKWYITNITNNNIKIKIRREGVCSLSFTSSSKFRSLPSNEKIDSFSGFFASFLVISSFFSISKGHPYSFFFKKNLWYFSFLFILSVLLTFFIKKFLSFSFLWFFLCSFFSL
jgi:hypothetical protein